MTADVVEALPDERSVVRLYCAEEDESSIEEYEVYCLTERISRAAMNRAASERWTTAVLGSVGCSRISARQSMVRPRRAVAT